MAAAEAALAGTDLGFRRRFGEGEGDADGAAVAGAGVVVGGHVGLHRGWREIASALRFSQ